MEVLIYCLYWKTKFSYFPLGIGLFPILGGTLPSGRQWTPSLRAAEEKPSRGWIKVLSRGGAEGASFPEFLGSNSI